MDQADVLITATDSSGSPLDGVTVADPLVDNGGGVQTSADVDCHGTTASIIVDGKAVDGAVLGTYTASDMVTTVPADATPPPTLAVTDIELTVDEGLGPCNPAAHIKQHWDDVTDGSDWNNVLDVFVGLPAAIDFLPKFQDGEFFNITSHQMIFKITEAVFDTLDQNGNDVYTTYNCTDPTASNYKDPSTFSSFSNPTVGDTGNDSNGNWLGYQTQLTITDDSVFSVDIYGDDANVYYN